MTNIKKKPNKILNYLQKKVSGLGHHIFLLSVVFILFSTLFLAAYAIYTQREAVIVYKEAIIAEFLNISSVLHQKPNISLSNLEQNYKKNPYVSMKLTHRPIFSQQIEIGKYWRLDAFFKEKKSNNALSLQITPEIWINFTLKPIQRSFIIPLILISVMSSLGGILLFFIWSIWRFMQPLQTLKEALDSLEIQAEPHHIQVYGPPIINEVAEAIHLLQKRIVKLLNARTLMLAAISHDLRTPLTRLRLQINRLPTSAITHELALEITEMEELIEQILLFTKSAYASNTEIEPISEINLTALLQTLVDENLEQGHTIYAIGLENKYKITARILALKRAFSNIINNALKYSKQATIKVYPLNTKKMIEIAVEDNGPGIAADNLEQVFEPFFREDGARSKQTGGFGLGLTITRDIIQQHHGNIWLENLASGGLRVVIQLPLESHKTALQKGSH